MQNSAVERRATADPKAQIIDRENHRSLREPKSTVLE